MKKISTWDNLSKEKLERLVAQAQQALSSHQNIKHKSQNGKFYRFAFQKQSTKRAIFPTSTMELKLKSVNFTVLAGELRPQNITFGVSAVKVENQISKFYRFANFL